MRTRLVYPSVVLAALVITIAGTLRSQNAPPSSSGTDRAKHILAISLLREINTAELDYKMKHGVYASKDVLLASDWFKRTEKAEIEPLAKAPLSSGPEILPGWSLRLNISAGGKSYDALLEDTTDKSCGYAAVTDERGVIRQSKAIDCDI